METLSDQSPFSRQSRERDEGRYVSGNLILWVAVIAVLIGLNFASWSFCMWVFGQPEHPMNYRMLTYLERLDPIHGFSSVTAPRGKFYSAKDIYAQVYPLSRTELRAYNGILKRHYLKNYLEQSNIAFLAGEFSVVSVRKLTPEDAFESGYAVRARSTIFPDAYLDLVLPSPTPPPSFPLAKGQVIKIEESSTCAAILHVDRSDDGTMIFTAVPLVGRNPDPETQNNSGIYRFSEEAVIEVWPPETIRLEPEYWPVSGEADEIEAKPVSLSPEATAEAEATEAAGAKASEQPEAAPKP